MKFDAASIQKVRENEVKAARFIEFANTLPINFPSALINQQAGT